MLSEQDRDPGGILLRTAERAHAQFAVARWVYGIGIGVAGALLGAHWGIPASLAGLVGGAAFGLFWAWICWGGIDL